ncbi:MAG: ATP-binding protein, partial [Anaerolineae bacterium]|nr:ATP-binding protein [Anaerolineae bacterium]
STLDQLRTIAHDLRPAALGNLGLDAALRAFCRSFAARTQLTISYVGQQLGDLPEAVEIGLFRFLQEALTNVARHAEAKSVTVQLLGEQKYVNLSVTDDGLGFDVSTRLGHLQEEDSIGLVGMKERIESVGGHLTILSEPGNGVTLVAWIPL